MNARIIDVIKKDFDFIMFSFKYISLKAAGMVSSLR